MKIASIVAIVSLLALILMINRDSCTSAQGLSDSLATRLVIIKGKATIINFPGRENMPATSERLIFQKVGCESCFVGRM